MKIIAAHPTVYSGVRFRSRLEARWAAFFDLVHWKWQYEPIDLKGWTPDFYVKFSCPHSECHGYHDLLVEVKPYFSIDDFNGHPCTRYPYGVSIDAFFKNGDDKFPADASAAFGINPNITSWEMCHGAGGGIYEVDHWVQDSNWYWKLAGNAVQYKRK